ncbi:MAG TPA: glycosyltransferase family 2 protein [Verrucomicrobiae bacterium]
MCRPEEIAVVVPCLNEGRTIATLVSEIRRFINTVIVVDDGSTDPTAAEARDAGAIVLTHTSPQGKGAALRAGFDLASHRGFSCALAMDGDGQHSPADIHQFLSRASDSPAALIIGNRMNTADHMPRLRRFVNRWMSQTIGSFCDTEIPDSQCGFRLVNLAAWDRVKCSADCFEIESEMIVRFLHGGYNIDFVPVETRYAAETSKIRPLRDTFRWFRWWFAIRHELASNTSASAEPQFESRPQDAAA